MRNIFILLIGIGLFTSCEDSSELYDYPVNKIGFLLEGNESRILTKTFIYDQPAVTRDTVYIRMRTMGFVTPFDRPVRLEQAEATEDEVGNVSNAVSGVHYVAFDDPGYAKLAVVKAGQAEVLMPVILLRDPSLQEEEVALKIRIAENDEFTPVNLESSERVILFSDLMIQPNAWDDNFAKLFGKWGPVKYQFMLEQTPELWDDAFIEVLMNDSPYLIYWQSQLRNLVDEENAKREEAGEGPLREEPAPGELEGILVSFP